MDHRYPVPPGQGNGQQSLLCVNYTDQSLIRTREDERQSCRSLQGCALGQKALLTCQWPKRWCLAARLTEFPVSVTDGGSLGVAWQPERDHGS